MAFISLIALSLCCDTANDKSGTAAPTALRTFEPGHDCSGQKLNRRHPSVPWSKLLGRQVQVEGVVWGAFAKADQCYIILENAVIYIDSDTFPKDELNGKIVRMRGTLAALDRRIQSHNPKKIYRHFVIRASRHWVLDRVSWPYMRQVKYIPKTNVPKERPQ